jgi:hypothetical protein
LRELVVQLAWKLFTVERNDAAADGHRQVRQRADDRPGSPELAPQCLDFDAGQDRDDDRLLREMRREPRHDLVELLRLAAEDDEPRRRARLAIVAHYLEAFDRPAAGANHHRAAEVHACGAPALHHGSGHVAAADEPDRIESQG